MNRTIQTEGAAGGELSRRDFLKSSSFGALGGGLGLSLGGLARGSSHSDSRRERSVIWLMLVGGPSQLDTFDPKPDAPQEIRGPFASIATTLPGVRVCEHLPLLARRMDMVTLVRSMHHDDAPIHETGLQLLQTGHLARGDDSAPFFGSRLSHQLDQSSVPPVSMILPSPIINTGVDIAKGQSAGSLGERHEPSRFVSDLEDVNIDAERSWLDVVGSPPPPRARNPFALETEPARLHERYGATRFGRSCLLARRLVEAGTRVVTVNMYSTVFNEISWDCHGSRPFSTLDDYRREVLPTFDRGFASLLDDLNERGLLESTLVVATGELGRTPRLNTSGGRDHWPGAWSLLLAGGPASSGCVVGRTDAHGSAPTNDPWRPRDLLALVENHLGLSASDRV